MISIEDYCVRVEISKYEMMTAEYHYQKLVTARQVYWRYLHENGFNYSRIARMFNYLSHATIIHGIKRINNLIEINDKQTLRLVKALDED
jgi:chromosomal replication initiation ATPase DnaA